MKLGDEVVVVRTTSLFFGMEGTIVRIDGEDYYIDVGSQYMEGIIVTADELDVLSY